MLETYPTLHHLVATVEGKLDKKYDPVDLIKATFPGGSITGAPKIRAMEIIDELEPTLRGPYAGCVGYLSYNGNLDTCITIRTIAVDKDKGYLQAGAGIVYDSDPKEELKETENKAGALLQAVKKAY